MKRTRLLAAIAGAALIAAPMLGSAQKTTFDLGKREFESNCVVCHGPQGKGDGPYLKFMKLQELAPKGTGDLTLIAKRSGGSFPFQRVYETIEGTQEVQAHGPREMPIWGKDYQQQARREYRDEDYERLPYDPGLYTRTRILALTDYLNRLQAR